MHLLHITILPGQLISLHNFHLECEIIFLWVSVIVIDFPKSTPHFSENVYFYVDFFSWYVSVTCLKILHYAERESDLGFTNLCVN